MSPRPSLLQKKTRHCLYEKINGINSETGRYKRMCAYNHFFIKSMLCLYEAGAFFIPSLQGGFLLETEGTPAKTGKKIPYKCFAMGRF